MSTYTNLETKGKIIKISSVDLVDKVNDPAMIFPDQMLTTRIEIETADNASHVTQVYCALPQQYLNKEAKLLQSYFVDKKEHKQIFLQQLYIENKQVMNQAYIRNE
jgi:hypothetical protein